MAMASYPNRFPAQGTAYVRSTLQTIHQQGTSVGGQVWRFLLAFPALAQGVYFVLTGIWPLVAIDSFMAVTGRKTDVWLVQTVGVLILVIGCALCLAAYRRQRPAEVVLIALGSALGLAAVDVFFVTRGQISAIYLVDAVAEFGIVCLWIASWYHEEAARPAAAATQATVTTTAAPPTNPVGRA